MRQVNIELHKPDLTLWGNVEAEIHESPSEELIDEVLAFYDATLVPELVCSLTAPDRPHRTWLSSKGKTIITCRNKKGELLAVNVVKDKGFMYPCMLVTKGKAGAIRLLRVLAYKSFEFTGDGMWATTDNSVIESWAKESRDYLEEGRPSNMPIPQITNGRMEWKL